MAGFTYNFAGTDFDEIRTLVSPELTVDEMPDATINYSVYKGEALSRINYMISGHLTDDQITAAAADLERALKTLTAALICPGVSQVIRERLEGDHLDYQPIDMTARSKDLMNSASDMINRVIVALDETAKNGVTDVFGLAGAPLKRVGNLEGSFLSTRRTGSGNGF